jgi:hypothetical protein
MKVISILIFSFILIGWLSKPLFSHTDHHKTEIKPEKKEHSENNHQREDQDASLQILEINTDHLQVKPTELILLLIIANPFLLHLLKNKLYK